MGNFKTDLAIGQSAEKEVGKLFENKGYFVVYNTAKTKEELKQWDLQISSEGNRYKIEVKLDLMASTTGNIAIEVGCVLESIADFFIYKFNGEFWYTRRQNLVNEISKQGRFVTGGDNGNSYMKLVKIDEFKAFSKQLK
jgi:hypothetical protein